MTILRKRENYRLAFDNFDPVKVAAFDEVKIEELLQNPGIVRNRQKVNSAVKNAGAFLKIQEEFGSFDAYIWGFVNGKPIQNQWVSTSELPAKTELFTAAFFQAVGLVNDHPVDCFRYHEAAASR